jgi:transposase
MYAAIHPSELAVYLKEVDQIAFDSRTGFFPEKTIDSARLLTSSLLSYSDDHADPADSASWLASEFLICRSIGSIMRSVFPLQYEHAELSKAFYSAPDVIFLYYFRHHGVDLNTLRGWMRKIPALSSPTSPSGSFGSGYSFQKTARKSGQKSGSLGGFLLSGEQWSKVQHLFPNPAHASRTRGRPRWSTRKVLDTILWKTAEGIEWETLPFGFPSKRTCTRFMESCTKDGRLPLVFLLLYEDLIQRTQSGPVAFDAIDEYFFLDPTYRVQIKKHFSRGIPELETWQLDTARLFLQYAYELIRYFRRKEKYRRFPY